MRVDLLLLIFDGAEELEQLALVLLSDAQPRVSYRNSQEVVTIDLLELDSDQDLPFTVGELESV